MATSEMAVTDLGAEFGRRERLADAWSLLFANKLALLGGILSIIFIGIGIVGVLELAIPSLNHLYLVQNLQEGLQPPLSPGHLLGTDQFGRDLAWRVAAGIGVSLVAGVAVTALSMPVGMAVGAAAGYYGGLLDRIVGGLIDLTWGFPVILVAVIIVGILSPGLPAVIVAISLVNWAGFARIIRAQVLSLREREFVEAAHALGVPDWKIILRHLVPNTIGTTLVMASYYIAITVIAEAGLAFIGLGAQPPLPSLGQLISTGRGLLYVDPWAAFIPGTAIALIVLGLNTLGDGLRDIFDPRLRTYR
ncbi:MAG: ABC transporter permease [Candidatus Dormibacteraeota bacterium]|nr:ABC transporter permease [Candidatus Dormibacteraeota bacterium]